MNRKAHWDQIYTTKASGRSTAARQRLEDDARQVFRVHGIERVSGALTDGAYAALRVTV